jgi:tetratricopeptide (TPR) repeat protein
MRKYLNLSVLLFFIYNPSFSQKDTTLLSREETKNILSQINIDTAKMLKDYSEKACSCIDSIKLRKKDNKEIAADIGECINRQTILYQSMMEINRAMKEGNLNIELNVDKGSRQYKAYYFRIEEWLTDSCASLSRAVEANNKEAEFSVSKDKKALEQYQKGMNFLEKENYKEALAWFEKAVNTDPKFAFAWDNIGICNRRLKNFDAALEAYNTSLALDPNGKTPLQNIPVVYEFKEAYDKAIEAYNKLLSVFPGDAEAYYGIGRMYIYKSDLEKGLDNMCKAYNLYVEMNSPYRVDAQNIVSGIYKQMKANGQEELFYKILKDNHISIK